MWSGRTYGYGRIPLLDVIAEQRRYIDIETGLYRHFVRRLRITHRARKGRGHIPALKEKIMQTINTQLTTSGRPPWVKWIAIAALFVVFAFGGYWFLTRRSTTTRTIPQDSMAAR